MESFRLLTSWRMLAARPGNSEAWPVCCMELSASARIVAFKNGSEILRTKALASNYACRMILSTGAALAKTAGR